MSSQLAFSSLALDAWRTRAVLGVNVADLGRDDAFALLLDAVAAGRFMKIAFCNAHCANIAWTEPAFRRTLADFTVLPDGVGVDIAARWVTGRPFKANLNGTDFVPALLATAPGSLRIAMIGGRPGVAHAAAARLAGTHPRHAYGPVLDGYADAACVTHFLDTLATHPADVLLVAMGNPLQEMWIARHVRPGHATLAIGVGALFDFIAGEARRAPAWIRRSRLEWAYRLAREPRRLFGRYVLGNPLFLLRVLADRAGGHRR